MKLDSIDAVYATQLKDLASVEKQLAAALEKLAEAADREELKQMFRQHQQETLEQGKKVTALIESMGMAVGRKKCEGIAGIIKEAQEVIDAKGEADAKDAALISAAQRAEHYEIAVYGTAVALAAQLGKSEDQQTLQSILDEEKQTDRKLSALATGEVNPAASEDQQADQGSQRQTSVQKGRSNMARRDEYESGGGYGGGRGGNSGGRGGYDDDDRGGYSRAGNRGSSGGYSSYDDDRGSRGGSYDGRSDGGYRSSQMQERDEYGQFAGYGGNSGGRGGNSGGGRGGYDDDDRGGSSRSGNRGSSGGYSSYDDDDRGGSRGGNRGGSYEGRSEGGYRSSQMQDRDEYGQFAGYGGGSSGGRGGNSGGRGGYDDDDRGSSSRSGNRGSSSRSSSYDDERGGSSRSGGRGGSSGSRGGDYVDSAGRHYTRESWERAQEGRALGGQHSHGSGRR